MTETPRRVMVTGASADSDIGLAICKELDAQGLQLILVGRRKKALEETRQQLSGSHHKVAPCDLSRIDDITVWFNEVVGQYGALSGLVHSASFQGYTPLRTIKPEQIQQYFNLNFSAALLMIAAMAKPGFHEQGASVVLIGSAAGARGLKGRTLYAASKAALASMTQSAALELASKQIRVNCLAPAVVTGTKADLQFSMLPKDQKQALLNAHPLGLSNPEDVAQSVAFLLSEQSKMITGVTLPVDGGYLAG